MVADSATIFVTKLAAAQRQLDAAIRMRLSGEDQLAVHTVLAAAYHILRDLKGKRSRRELVDNFSKGVFYIARDLASGKLPQIPSQIAEHGHLVTIITELANRIKAGEKLNATDMPISVPLDYEMKYWKEFNRPANFLKHADHDHGGKFSEIDVDNDNLIMRASAAYVDLIGKPTLEMCVYAAYVSKDDSDLDFLPKRAVERLKAADTAMRARLCLEILAELKQA